jgi:hypothetical protein
MRSSSAAMRAKRRASVNPATAGSFLQMSPTWMKALPYVSRSSRARFSTELANVASRISGL